MKEIGINPGQMQWEKAAGYPGGSEICVLRTDERGNARAFLLRAGLYRGRPHEHDLRAAVGPGRRNLK
jgi:hypothetical protein